MNFRSVLWMIALFQVPAAAVKSQAVNGLPDDTGVTIHISSSGALSSTVEPERFGLLGSDQGIFGFSSTTLELSVPVQPPDGSWLSGIDARPVLPLADTLNSLHVQCRNRHADGRLSIMSRRSVVDSPAEALLALGIGSEARLAPQIDKRSQLAITEGERVFKTGDLEGSLAHWRSVAAAQPDDTKRVSALLEIGQKQQTLGLPYQAERSFREALKLAQNGTDTRQLASVLNLLGSVLIASGRPGSAERILLHGRRVASLASEHGIGARIENNLGNAYAARGISVEKSISPYRRSISLAERAGDKSAKTRALANTARVLLGQGDVAGAEIALNEASALVTTLRGDREKLTGLIHLAKSYERAVTSGLHPNALRIAHDLLTSALELADELGDKRYRVYVFGNLGSLYAIEGRFDEALYLTRKALRIAGAGHALESSYRWHWQEGRILWTRGKRTNALASFERAVAALEASRQATLLRYADNEAYFRRLVAPIYLDLVNALLVVSAQRPHERARLLNRARDTYELLKTVELHNYLRTDCEVSLEARTKTLEDISPRAAVVYPIVFPDRLELLVGYRNSLTRRTVKLKAEQLQDTVDTFRSLLEIQAPSRDVQKYARLLYDWLVAPYANSLDDSVDTLVFVPDGVLRTIPLAALHDGERYLLERYATAVTPSLKIVDPRPIDAANARLLLAGLSKSVHEDFGPLNAVPKELKSIHALYGGKTLLDEEFTRERFEQSLREDDVSIVHVASHAAFSGSATESFVLAFDGPMSFGSVQATVEATQQPLELLVLSACDTASGDDVSVLGLAGLAVRAGARSALGSLWRIGDSATATLMGEFYAGLSRSDTKAAALRQAKLNMLHSRTFAHPGHWSAFVMVNNWL